MLLAGTFQRIVSESVGTEASSNCDLSANIAVDSIVLSPAVSYRVGDRLIIAVSKGAFFADAVYTLETSLGGAPARAVLTILSLSQMTEMKSNLELRSLHSVSTSSQDPVLLTRQSIFYCRRLSLALQLV